MVWSIEDCWLAHHHLILHHPSPLEAEKAEKDPKIQSRGRAWSETLPPGTQKRIPLENPEEVKAARTMAAEWRR